MAAPCFADWGKSVGVWQFLARDSIAYKTVEVRIMTFSPYGSPIPLVSAGEVSSRNSSALPASGSIKQGWGGENKPFPIFKRQCLKNGRR